VQAGMDVARLNFSHGSREDHKQVYDMVRHAADAEGRAVGILADLQGPKIRLGRFAAGPVEWRTGEEVRITVDDDRRGSDLQKRIAAVEADGIEIAGEQLKTRPRGVDPNHPRLELLRHKGLYGHRGWAPDDVLHEAGALDRVVATWRSVRPLVEWFDDHVGPSEQPRR
ncbi:MAG: hypothetical protein QOH17_1012, partial [Pseudonocardiales bacterium]|nr:hypothetical protein [Pseudonocardiales bacterium]